MEGLKAYAWCSLHQAFRLVFPKSASIYRFSRTISSTWLDHYSFLQLHWAIA